MTYHGSGGCRQAILGSELGQKRGKILAGKGPFERGRRLFVVVLKAEQAVLDLSQRGEVVWRQHLALDDGETPWAASGLHRLSGGGSRCLGV
jgi:hypothetical protein